MCPRSRAYRRRFSDRTGVAPATSARSTCTRRSTSPSWACRHGEGGAHHSYRALRSGSTPRCHCHRRHLAPPWVGLRTLVFFSVYFAALPLALAVISARLDGTSAPRQRGGIRTLPSFAP